MKFVLTIDLGNDAMQTQGDIAYALRYVSRNWADGQPEYKHEWKTAEQILGAFRKAREEW
jgi:hypothetical protein